MYHQSQPLDCIPHLLFFLFPCYLIYIQTLMFLDTIQSILHFSIFYLNFQVSSQYDTSFRSICIFSFDSDLTSSLTSSANNCIFDFWSIVSVHLPQTCSHL